MNKVATVQVLLPRRSYLEDHQRSTKGMYGFSLETWWYGTSFRPEIFHHFLWVKTYFKHLERLRDFLLSRCINWSLCALNASRKEMPLFVGNLFFFFGTRFYSHDQVVLTISTVLFVHQLKLRRIIEVLPCESHQQRAVLSRFLWIIQQQ